MSKVSRESAPDVTDYGPAEDRGAHFDGCAEASITTTANTGKRNGHLVAVGFAPISSTHGLTSRPQRST
jgi:hypothetical protein